MVKIQAFQGYTYLPEDYPTLLKYNHESISFLEEYKRAYIHRESTVEQIESGMLVKDPIPYFYVYMQTFMHEEMIGLIAEASLKDYQTGHIKVHQNTLCRQGYDHKSYAMDHVGPVVFSYNCDGGKVKNLLIEITKNSEPYTRWNTADGRAHSLWKVDQDCGLIELFNKIQDFYVLDGHHRLKAASENYLHNPQNPKAHFLQSIIYPPDEVSIHPFHRQLTETTEDLDVLKFLEEQGISYTEIKDATKQHLDEYEIIYRNSMGYYGINIDEGSNNCVLNLSVSKLKNKILDGIFESDDMHKYLRFVPGIHHWDELTKHESIFLVKSVKIEEIFRIADEKEIMPPKSTWFEPKPCNRMVVRLPY